MPPGTDANTQDWLAIAAMLRRSASFKRWFCYTFLAIVASSSYICYRIPDGESAQWGWPQWLAIAALALAGGLIGVPVWNALMGAQLSRIRGNLFAGGLIGRLVEERLDDWLVWRGDRPSISTRFSGGRSEQLNALSRAYEKLARESGYPTFASSGCLTITIGGMLLFALVLCASLLTGDPVRGLGLSEDSFMAFAGILPVGMMLAMSTVNITRASANAAVALALAEAIEDGSAFRGLG